MNHSEMEQILRSKKEYLSADVIQEIEKKRTDFIADQNGAEANEYWRLAVIYYIQNSYLSLYRNLRQRRYLDAWMALKETDVQLIMLEQNFSLGDESEDPYHLYFIRNILQEYEKLFPYEYFVCRESVVKQEKCSICGEIVKLRGGCGHIPGKIYMGELCMHEVTDQTYLQPKIVRDPFDKYEYLDPYQSEQLQYNYGLLDGLMESIHSPYNYWYVEIVKEKNTLYAKTGRNDLCPCGSGKKFKFCCMNNEDRMYFEHYKIKLMNEMDEKVDRPLRLI